MTAQNRLTITVRPVDVVPYAASGNISPRGYLITGDVQHTTGPSNEPLKALVLHDGDLPTGDMWEIRVIGAILSNAGEPPSEVIWLVGGSDITRRAGQVDSSGSAELRPDLIQELLAWIEHRVAELNTPPTWLPAQEAEQRLFESMVRGV